MSCITLKTQSWAEPHFYPDNLINNLLLPMYMNEFNDEHFAIRRMHTNIKGTSLLLKFRSMN